MPVKFTEITFLAHGSESSAVLGSLRKGVFEQLSLTGSEACTECLYNTIIETICPKLQAKPLPKNAKSTSGRPVSLKNAFA